MLPVAPPGRSQISVSRLAIYGHGERLTHPHILQLGAAQVEGIEVGAQQRQTPDPLR